MSHGTVNRAMVIGRLGKNPEIHYTPKGIPFAMFSLATNRAHKNEQGETISATDWHKIIAWSGLAEVCGQYLKKGSLVCIEGSLKTRKWNDKDGKSHMASEILAENMQMLGKKLEPQ